MTPSEAAQIYRALQAGQRALNRHRIAVRGTAWGWLMEEAESDFMEMSRAQDLLWDRFVAKRP